MGGRDSRRGGAREGEESGGQDTAPGCAGRSPNHSLTGHHWTYEGESRTPGGLALFSPWDTPPPSPDTKTSGEEELSLSVTR